MTRFLRLNCAAYNCLLIAYPNAFRDRFEVEMIEVFTEDLVDTYRKRGLRGVSAIWLRSGLEVFRVAIPERLMSPPLAAPLASIAVHAVLFGTLIVIGEVFQAVIPHTVLHGIVNLGIRP